MGMRMGSDNEEDNLTSFTSQIHLKQHYIPELLALIEEYKVKIYTEPKNAAWFEMRVDELTQQVSRFDTSGVTPVTSVPTPIKLKNNLY